MTPNPDACESITGTGQMCADLEDGTTLQPTYAYVCFDLDDGDLVGSGVEAVTLELTVTSAADAPSPSSAQIWRVAPFGRDDLFAAVPSPIGSKPVAGDMGPVANGETVRWTLPSALAAPGTRLCLGVIPTSKDGVNYWNLAGEVPPRLVVDHD